MTDPITIPRATLDRDMPTQYLTYKMRLLPTRKQHLDLSGICEAQRILYNAALEERIGCYRVTGKGRSYVDQCRALTELRKDKDFSSLPSTLQRWTLKRLDEAYRGFFKRLKKSGRAGFPRFRGRGWWKAFGFSEFRGIKFDGKRIRFKGLSGGLRVHMHRQFPKDANIKSCVFRRDVKGWYICFQLSVPLTNAKHIGKSIGIDVGLTTFATLSNGDTIPNPRIARRCERELRRRQRALSRCRKGSNRRQKIKKRVTALHEKIANTRRTFLHQQSARLTKQYGIIAVENLNIRGLTKTRMAKSIHDASWGMFINMLAYKAERAGGELKKVDPRNTTQACSGCGVIVPKALRDRVHSCQSCGLVLSRDENAAHNVLHRAVVRPVVDKLPCVAA